MNRRCVSLADLSFLFFVPSSSLSRQLTLLPPLLGYATFYTSAALKILYDLGLLAMFLKTKLPEHGRDGQIRQVTVADVDVGILLSENFRRPEEFEEVLEDEGDLGQGGYHPPSKGQYEHIEDV